MKRTIRFEVTTATPLEAGEQVFLSGNLKALGNWNPAGFPLTRIRDNIWARTVKLPDDETIHLKITRGSWGSEEVTPDGQLPADKILEAGTGDVTAQYWIHHWKDLRSIPPDITGHYDILENIHSNILNNQRTVVVWLPPSYYKNTTESYPVIYMQDGQQVFDPNTSTWNQAWNVDEWCTAMTESKQIKEAIIVGVYCSPERDLEYNADERGEDYISFLTNELMPIINQDFRTLTGPENTGIAGGSLGGSISFYAAWKHPELFSMVACLSPAFDYKGSKACLDLVKKTKTKPAIKVYLYCGSADPLEEELLPGMKAMKKALRAKKFVEDDDLLVIEDELGHHNEETWNRHSGEWLHFLLGV